MRIKVCFLLLLSAVISGCGSSNIDAIKESAFAVDESFTVAQALDGRPICSDHSWDEYEDDRGRLVVEYSCEMKGASEYFSQSEGDVKQYLSRSLGYRVEQNKKQLGHLQSRLKAAPQMIEDAINEYKENDDLEEFTFVNYPVYPYRDCGILTSGYSDDKVAELRTCLDKKISNAESTVERLQSEVDEFESKILRKSDVVNISSATETFKWIVSEEKLYYHGGGITLKRDDQPDLYFAYMEDGGRYGYSMKQALRDTLDDEFQDYADLAESRDAVPGARQAMSKL